MADHLVLVSLSFMAGKIELDSSLEDMHDVSEIAWDDIYNSPFALKGFFVPKYLATYKKGKHFPTCVQYVLFNALLLYMLEVM